jgi:hypothetical protein
VNYDTFRRCIDLVSTTLKSTTAYDNTPFRLVSLSANFPFIGQMPCDILPKHTSLPSPTSISRSAQVKMVEQRRLFAETSDFLGSWKSGSSREVYEKYNHDAQDYMPARRQARKATVQQTTKRTRY